MSIYSLVIHVIHDVALWYLLAKEIRKQLPQLTYFAKEYQGTNLSSLILFLFSSKELHSFFITHANMPSLNYYFPLLEPQNLSSHLFFHFCLSLFCGIVYLFLTVTLLSGSCLFNSSNLVYFSNFCVVVCSSIYLTFIRLTITY